VTITNHSGLPQPIVDAVRNDPYNSGDSDISVTRLIQPPRKVELERRHNAEITEDASDRIWALMGQLGHLILERAGNGAIVEKRLFGIINGCKVSGQVDLIGDTIVDYKFTSIWAVKEGIKDEWIQQLNLNRYLAHMNNMVVNHLQIVAILRDWSKPEAARNRELPQSQVVVMESPVWTMDESEAFMVSRVKLHMGARDSGRLPLCTDDETWQRPQKWAIMKPGNKRASKLCDTLEEAERLKSNGSYVEFRPGERPRCEHYCNAAPFCSQFREWKFR
jgi:hypothetical protein